MPGQAEGLRRIPKEKNTGAYGRAGKTDRLQQNSNGDKRKAQFYGMLAEVVESELIPSLAQHYASTSTGANGKSPESGTAETEVSPPLGKRDVLQLVDSLLGKNTESSSAIVWQHLSGGSSVEEVYLNLLAPAARELGDLWINDHCSFYDVTLGASQLQCIMRDCASSLLPEKDRTRHQLNIALGPAPDEQHQFGICMIEEFFRNRGWNVVSLIGCEDRTVIDVAAHQKLDVVALSCSCSGLIDALADEISQIREHSLNPNIKILVGGYVFQEDDNLVKKVGGDLTAGDAWHSVKLLDQLDWTHKSLAD